MISCEFPIINQFPIDILFPVLDNLRCIPTQINPNNVLCLNDFSVTLVYNVYNPGSIIHIM